MLDNLSNLCYNKDVPKRTERKKKSMRVELTANLFHLINECAANVVHRCVENDVNVELHCELCPLRGACLEVLTGDNSENK